MNNSLMVCPSSGSVLTGDIRIDNRKEPTSDHFANRKVTEITEWRNRLAAYERWGQDMLPNLSVISRLRFGDPKQQRCFCG
jgi:hypothetical protein